MLRIPEPLEKAAEFAKELVDETMATSQERGMVYEKASQYYYQGTADSRAAIHNKVRPFVDRLAGFLYLPQSVRFNIVYGPHEPDVVLERAKTASQLLTAEYRAHDSDLMYGQAVTWGLNCGAYLLKHLGEGSGFKAVPVHPVNFGVLQ